MYTTPGKGGAAVSTAVGLATGATLPATGASQNMVVIAAIAVAAALVVWGVVYAIKNRVN